MRRLFFIFLLPVFTQRLSAQDLKFRYFDWNENIGYTPDTNLNRFLTSYNSNGPKPPGSNGYGINPMNVGFTMQLMAGFCYRQQNDFLTVSLTGGGSTIRDYGFSTTNTVWNKSISDNQYSLGIGYMKFGWFSNSGRPRINYGFHINGEYIDFYYHDEAGSKDGVSVFKPSYTAFLQYNVYPKNWAKGTGFSFNFRYHSSFTPTNLSFLSTDLNYASPGSLKTTLSDISLGIGFRYMGQKTFLMYPPVPEDILWIKIITLNSIFKNEIMDAQHEVYYTFQKKRKIPSSKGKYKIDMKNSESLPILVQTQARGYFSKKDTLEIDRIGGSAALTKIVLLQPVVRDKPFKKIYFVYATSKVVDSSSVALNSVYEMLRDNPQIHIRIEGHTAGGDEHLNAHLSHQRANFIEHYLVQHGIRASRLKALGMGSSEAVFQNDTEENIAHSRRVEIFIVQD